MAARPARAALTTTPSAAPFLPYGRQQIDESDIAAVAEVLRGDWLTTGPAVAAFERALAARLQVAHAVACSSGTAALHLACLALGLGPGDAAIVPTITFLATANAVRMTGAAVVFADVDAETGLMEPAQLAAAWRRADAGGLRVKAVFAVHLAGQCGDLGALADMAQARGAVLVEDACHALGTLEAGGTPVGACRSSAMTVLSFHPVKTIAAGEGGAVTTQDAILAERLARLRNHGMSRAPEGFANRDLAFDGRGEANPWYYEMAEMGWNYRLSDIHAALAQSQLRRLDAFIAARRDLALAYDALLRAHGDRVRPIRRVDGCVPAWHLYAVLIDFDRLGQDRAAVMTGLKSHGIGTQVHYIPVHRQPYYAETGTALALDGADAYYRRTLSLPLFVGMTGADIRHVVSCLIAMLNGTAITGIRHDASLSDDTAR